jgi:hypothetical protein
VDEHFDPMFRAFLECLPLKWMAGEMHVTRLPRKGRDRLKVVIRHPKGTGGESGPSKKLMETLEAFVASAPEDWTSYRLKAKRKKEGGWDVKGDFRADEEEREAAKQAADKARKQAKDGLYKDFGARALGTYVRLRVRPSPKGGWELARSRRFLFIPLGTSTVRLAGSDRIYVHTDINANKHIIELECQGRPSILVYEGKSRDQQKWIVDSLQALLQVTVEKVSVLSR